MVNKPSDCWQTPDWLFKELDAEFHFDIDLCATKANSKCSVFGEDYLADCYVDIKTHTAHMGCPLYDVLHDSVSCFMNPPYSNPRPFIEKAWDDSRFCKIVCLVKCDPSTRWWATFWNYTKVGERDYLDLPIGPKPGCEVRFFPKRIKFTPPNGFVGKTSGPTFPCALVIFDRRGL